MPTTKLNSFIVHYHNFEEYHHIKQEIFGNEIYHFETTTARPVIFDLGAHIGLSTLYFKYLYPLAQITSVEPHPTNFELLEDNIWQNQLENVQPVQAAITDRDVSTLKLHADIDYDWFSTASFQPKAWNQEQNTQPLSVPAIKLSELISKVSGPIDLIKMDIEGSEQLALMEAGTLLDRVQQLRIEFHPIAQQNLGTLWKFLESRGFSVSSTKQRRAQTFPNQLQLLTATRA